MTKFLSYVAMGTLIALFSGCALLLPQEEELTQEAPPILQEEKFKLILLKTPQYSFYDFGTIKKNKDNELSIDFYKLGKVIARIKITRFQICINNSCSLKWPTVKTLMGEVSYGSLVEDIFQAKDIFNAQGLVIDQGVITQHFITNKQEIYYQRIPGKVVFQNRALNIHIVIEDYNQ